MNYFKKTIIIRHRRENLKKCSLAGLEERDDLCFLSYPNTPIIDLSGYFILTMDQSFPFLSEDDSSSGILLLDATWKLAEKMEQQLHLKEVPKRALPSHFQTAYPRRNTLCPDPKSGLASVEALFIAYHLLKRDASGLLDHYHWKDPFLKLNQFPVPVPDFL